MKSTKYAKSTWLKTKSSAVVWNLLPKNQNSQNPPPSGKCTKSLPKCQNPQHTQNNQTTVLMTAFTLAPSFSWFTSTTLSTTSAALHTCLPTTWNSSMESLKMLIQLVYSLTFVRLMHRQTTGCWNSMLRNARSWQSADVINIDLQARLIIYLLADQTRAHTSLSQSRRWKVSKDVRQRSFLVLATWHIKNDYSGSSYLPWCTGELVATWSRYTRYSMDTMTPKQLHAYNSASIRVPEVTPGNCTYYSHIWIAESADSLWE